MANINYSRLKVLVIDDQPFIRSIIANLLKAIGFNEIEKAEDGASGLKMCNSFNPDLIICDIEMEPVDGLVFLQTLRESDDIKNPDAKVIFLTQHADSETVSKARALNVDFFVTKPPSMEKLKSRIDFALSHSD